MTSKHQAQTAEAADQPVIGSCPDCNLAHESGRPCTKCGGTQTECIPFAVAFWCRDCGKYFCRDQD